MAAAVRSYFKGNITRHQRLIFTAGVPTLRDKFTKYAETYADHEDVGAVSADNLRWEV